MSLIVDVVAVILLAGNVYLGWRLGLFGRMFAFAGFYAGVAAAGFAGNAIERFFHGGGNQSDLWAAGWTFLGVVAAVTLMLEILGALYREKVRGITTLAFDRTAGAIAGVVVAGFEIALVAIVWLAVGNTSDRQFTNLPADRTQARQGIDNSLITSHVSRLDPAVQSVLKPVLPGDLSSSLADTTTNGKDSQAK
ncbi:MAG: CvpA family protein [Chloroflexi bacterium]|nr:MAG: CvpA family protein [Chloroflexota bacterium]